MQEINMIGKKKLTGVRTRLLMHLDGDIADVAGNPMIIASGVSYMTNQKFGKKAATFTTGGYIYVPKNPNTTLFGDMTYEFIVTFPVNLPAGIEQIVFSNQHGFFADFLSGFAAWNGGKPCWLVSFSANNDKTKILTINAPWNDGLPHHFAACRKNGVFTVYLDGVPAGTVASSTPYEGSSTVIGNYFAAPSYGLNKNCMQEVRLSDIARYTAPFTPSATPFVLD